MQDKLTAKAAAAQSFISREVEEVMKTQISSEEAVMKLKKVIYYQL